MKTERAWGPRLGSLKQGKAWPGMTAGNRAGGVWRMDLKEAGAQQGDP